MSGLRSLYDWALKQAEKPYATWLLFVLAMTEPCISPVPPDVLLIPMAIAQREKAFRLAMLCLLGVIIGTLIGYTIGAVGMATVGHYIVDRAAFKYVHKIFDHWGLLIVIAKGIAPVIPIPLTFLVIASGMAHLNLALVLISMVAAQGARFFLEAWLLHRFGKPARRFIEHHLTWVVLVIVALVCLMIVLCSGVIQIF